MPRSRASRRRRLLLFIGSFLLLSTAATFVGDIRNAAHKSSGPLSNINKNFGELANSILKSDNSFDKQFLYLLTEGGTMSRVALWSRLSYMTTEITTISNESQNLLHPPIADNFNTEFVAIVDQRVHAWLTLLNQVETGLILPTTTPGFVQSPNEILRSTAKSWNHIRHKLQNEPGKVRFIALSNRTDNYVHANGLGGLIHAQGLHLVRGVTISTVQIRPAPLPMRGDTLVVPATGHVHFAAVVSNQAYATQPVTIRFTLSDNSGLGPLQTLTMSYVLGPMASHAFVPMDFKVSSNEHATLAISLVGAPHGPGVATGKTYKILTTPAG